MRCPACGTDGSPAAKFCEECGARLARACPRCSHEVGAQAKFCSECGEGLAATSASSPMSTPLQETAARLVADNGAARPPVEGEHKQVTVLFCDLVNSTALAEHLGPEGMHQLLGRFFELAVAEVHRYEGTINKFLGDGFMALFGVPVAHEDHARRAILAALGIGRRLGEAWAHPDRPGSTELAVRMGLNTGPVVVGRLGDDLEADYTAIGDTTNVAARLEQVAEPGTIVLSEGTARLVTGYARVEPIGPIDLKGKSGPVAAYRLLGAGPRRSPLEGEAHRALSRFVGRDRQQAELQDLLEQAEQGRGHVAGIVAEPGMGKSRLVYEFQRSLAGKRVTYLEGRCLSYGGAIPYLPILDIVRSNCGIGEADSPEAMAEKVRFGLREVGMDADYGAPYLLRLLGVREGADELGVLSPEAIKGRTFEVLRQMAIHGSRRRPIVFVVEDLHWIDRTSEEYIRLLVEGMAGASILLLCTYRAGYLPPWMEQSYATHIALRRLTPGDGLTVVRSVFGVDEVPDSLADLILSKAEGIPFFLEELSKAVSEHDDLRAELAVPNTVQGVLMARIDRLADEPRRVLQTASVLGREFPLRLLGMIWDGPGVLEPHLHELTRLEFLYEQVRAGEPVYVFKHALTQDVAYESLLVSRRQILHAAAGRALEVLYADHLEEAYDRLAHHYSKTDRAAKAIEYLSRLADTVTRTYAHADAVRALEEALGHVDRLPADEQDGRFTELCAQLAASNYFLGRFSDTVALLTRHAARVERLQDPARAGRFYFELGHAYSHLGQSGPAIEHAQRAVDEAERCGDDATRGKAHYVLTKEAMWACRFSDGVEHGQTAATLLEQTDERWWLGQTHCWVGINLYFLGNLDAALASADTGRAIGQDIGDRRLQSYAEWNTAWFSATRGDGEAAVRSGTQSLERSPDPLNTAFATAWLGYAHREQGELTQAIDLLEQGIERLDRMQYSRLVGWFCTWLGETHLLAGDIPEARRWVSRGLEVSEGVDFRWAVGAARRALGRIDQAGGSLREAEGHLVEALEIFSSINARFDVGLTHLVLADVARAEGCRDGGMEHLVEAEQVFDRIQVSRYRERIEQLAHEMGLQSKARALP